MIRWKMLAVAAPFAGFTLPPPAQREGATMGRDALKRTPPATDLILENPR